MQQIHAEKQGDIHLSVVATSRNDNHGGSLTRRMQHFVDGFVAQCKRHGLRAELILVEWNPPADRVPLAQELRWPADTSPCDIRIVTVPPEIHRTFDHSDKLPLFQMIAKNVGIRRARGKFVLATNIDILFSDAAIRYMRDKLQPGRLYRADRLDVPTEVPDPPEDFCSIHDFCWNNYFRINANQYTASKHGDEWSWPVSKFLARLDPLPRHAAIRVLSSIPFLRQPDARTHVTAAPLFLRRCIGGLENFSLKAVRCLYHPVHAGRLLVHRGRMFFHRIMAVWKDPRLFTNACGDFTLMSLADWGRLRGYPEWPIFSWHIDSVFLYQSAASGIREAHLGHRAPVFHIEHGKGSGYTPEGAAELFSRLDRIGLPYLSNEDFLRIQKEQETKASTYNGPDWGLEKHGLPVTIIH